MRDYLSAKTAGRVIGRRLILERAYWRRPVTLKDDDRVFGSKRFGKTNLQDHLP